MFGSALVASMKFLHSIRTAAQKTGRSRMQQRIHSYPVREALEQRVGADKQQRGCTQDLTARWAPQATQRSKTYVKGSELFGSESCRWHTGNMRGRVLIGQGSGQGCMSPVRVELEQDHKP